MGLSHFHTPADGVLPLLVMNAVLSVALLKNLLRSLLQTMGATASRGDPADLGGDSDGNTARERRVSITQFKSLSQNLNSSRKWRVMECCVCLCRFEAEEEVSELSCKHVFHRCCLEKWFANKRLSCPLCRSTL